MWWRCRNSCCVCATRERYCAGASWAFPLVLPATPVSSPVPSTQRPPVPHPASSLGLLGGRSALGVGGSARPQHPTHDVLSTPCLRPELAPDRVSLPPCGLGEEEVRGRVRTPTPSVKATKRDAKARRFGVYSGGVGVGFGPSLGPPVGGTSTEALCLYTRVILKYGSIFFGKETDRYMPCIRFFFGKRQAVLGNCWGGLLSNPPPQQKEEDSHHE